MSLLPPNATFQERALSEATARISSVPVKVREVWSPYECPLDMLPWLAWALSVDDWNSEWNEKQKRDAIAASVEIHRHKGTIGAVRRALQAIGYEVTIDENTGVPYTFRLQVDVSNRGVTDSSIYNEAERIALVTKNARSHLLGVDALLTVSQQTRITAAAYDGEETAIWPNVVAHLEQKTFIFIYAAEHSVDFAKVFPRKDSLIKSS